MADFDPDQPAAPRQNVTDSLVGQAPEIVTKTMNEQLPQGCTKVFKLAYWQQFFELTQRDIMQRALQALIIFKGDFLTDCALAQPDFFMPFWIPVTLIFLMFFSSAILWAVKDKVSFSTGFYVFLAVILSYVYIITAILYGVAYCFDMNVSYTACMQLSAYSLLILIPTCVLIPLISFMPISVLPIIFSISALWSMIFMTKNVIQYGKTQSTTGIRKAGFMATFLIVHAVVLIALGCALFV